jgi:hypothetical protein
MTCVTLITSIITIGFVPVPEFSNVTPHVSFFLLLFIVTNDIISFLCGLVKSFLATFALWMNTIHCGKFPIAFGNI